MILPNGYNTKYNLGDKLNDSENKVQIIGISLSNKDEFKEDSQAFNLDTTYAYTILALSVPNHPEVKSAEIRLPILVIDNDPEIKLCIGKLLTKL